MLSVKASRLRYGIARTGGHGRHMTNGAVQKNGCRREPIPTGSAAPAQQVARTAGNTSYHRLRCGGLSPGREACDVDYAWPAALEQGYRVLFVLREHWPGLSDV